MKKRCAVLLAAALSALLLFPVSAETPSDLSGNVVTSVDYRNEDPLDKTGNLAIEGGTDVQESIEYVDFDGVTCVINDSVESSNGIRMMYTQDHYQTLNHVFTLETDVYMSATLEFFDIVLWYGGEEPNFAKLIWHGDRFAFCQGHGESSEEEGAVLVEETEARELEDGWYHVVVTANAAQEMCIYVNGELTGTGTYLRHPDWLADPEGVTDDARKCYGGMWGLWYYFICKEAADGYGIAYLTIYNTPATAEQVKTMFDPTYQPSASPSDAPATDNPSPSQPGAPTSEPPVSEAPTTGSSSSTAVPTKAPTQSNSETFDMGVISLAAMAVSSLVMVKKKNLRK